jgi:hypothetical protein
MGQVGSPGGASSNGSVSPIPLKNSTAEAFDPSVKADGELERPALRPA